MTVYILDLDNTIANDGWRIPKIDWQHANPFRRYHRYHILSGFDEPGNIDLFAGRRDAIILTARPNHYRAITEEWLQRNHVHYSILMMRNDDDHRHSCELKRNQVGALLGGEYPVQKSDITCAFDDRQDVIDMYLSLGIPAYLRSIHDVCAYTNHKGT